MSLTPTLVTVAPRSGIGTMRLDPPPIHHEPDRRRRTPRPSRRARAAAAVGGAVLLMLGSTEWSAAASAYIPYAEYGSRGPNVVAIQHLLRHRGYDLPATGWFGPMTYRSVRAFQQRARLRVTGKVNQTTWLRMAPAVIVGHRSEAVRAVQVLLNAKLPAGLAVDGRFGSYTKAAVIAFQRRHRLAPDGGVGPITWRYLASQYTQPSFSSPSICAYPTKANAHRAHWGTSDTVGAVSWAVGRVRRAGHGEVAVGDISLRGGGFILGHVGHQDGLEADIRPMRHDKRQCSLGVTWYRWSNGRKVCCNPAYDRAATRALVIALRSSGMRIRDLAFNDPALIREGLTDWFAGHDDHIHVAYCERYHPEVYFRC
jgi:peptidoglycan hydrolase-like protein with peptidoglycan-binding domain